MSDLKKFIQSLPKTDLHVHLDGSVRIPTIIDLAKQQKYTLPSFTEAGLNELVFKDHYQSLVEYLQGFGHVVPLMQTPENLERISYEFAWDNINEGVCYVEVRFAPQLHMNEKQGIEAVLLSVAKGLERAKSEYNQKAEVKSGVLPPFHYGIIVCAMRAFGKGFSKFFDDFIGIHGFSELNDVFGMASLELVKACVAVRDRHDIPIVAFDLAGPEAGHPPSRHKEAFHFARKNLMHATVHAGEAYGAESIFQAMTDLYAERIGHGFHLFSEERLQDPSIEEKGTYLDRLIQFVANSGTTIEVCLTSNLQTIPELKSLKEHPFGKMLRSKISTSLCTDNRTVSKTTVSAEWVKAVENFNLSFASVKEILLSGFEDSFFPGSYVEKRALIKNVRDRLDSVKPDLTQFKS